MRNPEDQADNRQLSGKQLIEVRSNPTIPVNAQREHSTYSQEDKAFLAMREEIERLRDENSSLRRKYFRRWCRFDTESESYPANI